MEKTLRAYTDEDIVRFFAEVRENGLTEHGFPRLTANLGILICHGIRTELSDLFCEMMEFCCKNIPLVKAANNFSVKEIIFCIKELEKSNAVGSALTDRWKEYLKTIIPENCYERIAKKETDEVRNWALFAGVSEYIRQYFTLCNSEDFINTQISSQVQWLDENGMYRDKPVYPPMVYDLVSRGLFALLLHFGFKGKHYREIDFGLKKAGLLTLKMQSVTGEIPFGGRSNQFLFNEALIAIIFEYESNRYAAKGDLKTAQEFKAGVRRALDNIELWLSEKCISHIKNRFCVNSKYGCEDYAYYDKYMITTASFLYTAYLICDDTIFAKGDIKAENAAFCTSDEFHKIFMRNGEYALEFETKADLSYDVSGLGRIHKKGAPSAICLSLPCTDTPVYTIDEENTSFLSLCPGILCNGQWKFAADKETEYKIAELTDNKDSVFAEILCRFCNGESVQTKYKVNEDGVNIEVRGNEDVAYMLPAFCFDGKNKAEITFDKNSLTVSYMGWICRYITDGEIIDYNRTACNRNGHYKVFLAISKKTLKIKVEILKLSEKC